MKRLWIEWQCAGEQLVEQDTQRIDVRPSIYILSCQRSLLRAHILRRADQFTLLSEQGSLRQGLSDGLGYPKINHLGHSLITIEAHQYVRRFYVTVDNPLLMGMLDGFTYLKKQFETLLGIELIVVAVFGDGLSFDVFHHKIRPAFIRGPCVEDTSYVWMIQQSQCLTFSFKPADYLLGVHSELDDLQCHLPPNRFFLLSSINYAEATFAQNAKELVMADLRTQLFR